MNKKTGNVRHETLLFVVDRREGATVVVIDDDGNAHDVQTQTLPPDCRAEGAVIRVVVGAKGKPEWKTALRDKEEERRRREDLQKRVDNLKRTDAGGDVEL
ncbi:MAG TPA: DUF3006 family protein [Gemmatimonadaceae bacterium]|nr:DUF3006 family protein [Gemmatimonadaceae bacterium]